MKNMKRIACAVIAIMMVLSMCVSAFAASDHTITINKTSPNHVFDAYQIFDGVMQMYDPDSDASTPNSYPVLSELDWGSGVDISKSVEWTADVKGKPVTAVSLKLIQALKNVTINPDYAALYASIPDAPDPADPIYKTDKDIAQAVSEVLSENDSTDHALVFAEIVGKYLKGTPASSKAYNATDAEIPNTSTDIAYYQIKDLDDGYYLVKEKDTTDIDPETRTLYMLRLVENVTLTPKDGTVSLDKIIVEGATEAVSCANNIGDIIEFDITGTLPERYNLFDTFEYTFVDHMSEGLTYVAGSLKVETVNGDVVKEILPADGLYEFDEVSDVVKNVTDDEKGEALPSKYGNATRITVTIPDVKAIEANSNYTVTLNTKLRITYKAYLNENAEIGNPGNPNEAKIVFDNDPYSTTKGETGQKEVHVFTFELDTTKTDGQNGKTLNGAKFRLYRERGGHKQYVVMEQDDPATTTIDESQFVSHWTNWIDEADLNEYIASRTDLTVEKQNELKTYLIANYGYASVLESKDGGKVLVKGLDVDTYWLKEIDAPDGYSVLDEPTMFYITATYTDTEVTALKLTVSGKEPADGNLDTGVVQLGIVNNPGHTLPSTGGIGTTLFYIVGGVLFVGAAVMLITKKRMSSEK